MAENVYCAEAAQNYEQKCLCVLVLDVSGSMRGKPMDELNKGLQYLYSEFANDVYISPKMEVPLITFNNLVKIIQEPSLIASFRMPHLSVTDNSATTMEDAVNSAINLVEHRKEWYKMTGQTYYRPLIVLISSVEPNGTHSIDALAKRIKKDTANKKYSFITIGADISNMEILNKFCSDYSFVFIGETGFSNILYHFERLLDSERPLTKEKQNESVDLSDLDWALNFSI